MTTAKNVASKGGRGKGRDGRRSAGRATFVESIAPRADADFVAFVNAAGKLVGPKRGRPAVVSQIEIKPDLVFHGDVEEVKLKTFGLAKPTVLSSPTRILVQKFASKEKRAKSPHRTRQRSSKTVDLDDPREMARAIGGPPGTRLTQLQTKQVFDSITTLISDLFATPQLANAYLESTSFDASKLSARELIRAGKTATVLSGLDELRYGSRG